LEIYVTFSTVFVNIMLRVDSCSVIVQVGLACLVRHDVMYLLLTSSAKGLMSVAIELLLAEPHSWIIIAKLFVLAVILY
jgi:hypothetical protein